MSEAQAGALFPMPESNFFRSTGLWAAQHLRVQHPLQIDVAGVGGAAADALGRVDARRGVADHLHRVHAHRAPPCVRVVEPAAPAATTASTMRL